ncbi:FecR/PupR family sigma factor regulator [Variovorax paradoxus]|uniref:FecR/PupR family sigma factor regulator n=1 Tax=Variovorax paradoxus TaxID=34073 RepID=UPI0035C8CCFB
MEPTPRDDRPTAGHDACLGEAFDWLVRLNRRRASEAEAFALQVWCGRSAVHAQAWREALALWRALLPAACAAAQRAPRRPRRASGTRTVSRRAAAPGRGTSSDVFPTQHRPGQSWS